MQVQACLDMADDARGEILREPHEGWPHDTYRAGVLPGAKISGVVRY